MITGGRCQCAAIRGIMEPSREWQFRRDVFGVFAGLCEFGVSCHPSFGQSWRFDDTRWDWWTDLGKCIGAQFGWRWSLQLLAAKWDIRCPAVFPHLWVSPGSMSVFPALRLEKLFRSLNQEYKRSFSSSVLCWVPKITSIWCCKLALWNGSWGLSMNSVWLLQRCWWVWNGASALTLSKVVWDVWAPTTHVLTTLTTWGWHPVWRFNWFDNVFDHLWPMPTP